MSQPSENEIYFSFFMFTADLQPENEGYTKEIVGHMHRLRDMGYNGFDLHIADRPVSEFDEQKELAAYRRLKQALDKEGFAGMKFATNVGTTRDYDPTHPDPEKQKLALRYLKSRVEITKALGGEGAIMSGPFLYPYGAFPEPPIWSDALQDWIKARLTNADEIMEALADFADEQKVKLALEPVKNWETPPPNMVSEVLDYVEHLESKPCGITIDTAQVIMESQGPEAFKRDVKRAAALQLLNYVHISPPDRGAVHDSWIPWDLMLGELKDRYQGPYLIEIFNAIHPFDGGMRMARPRFWWSKDDEARPAKLNAYHVADQARKKLILELNRVPAARSSGDEFRTVESFQRHQPGTGSEGITLGSGLEQTDSADDLAKHDNSAQESAHPEDASFPFIVSVNRYGGIYNWVRIHSFVASSTGNNLANATHIIENTATLVVVDGQFLAPYARQFAAYIKRLHKPIERIYLSHRHPDHWFGMPTAFPGRSVYALPETIKWIEENGEESLKKHVERLGEDAKTLAPTTYKFPMKPIQQLGGDSVMHYEENFGGIRYGFEKEPNAEVESQLIIKLPDFGVAIVQDLIYSGTHLYLTKAMDHWRKLLGELALSDYHTFLAGHGEPADKTELLRNIEYLIAAEEAFDGGKGMKEEELHKYLLDRYHARLCPGIFPIYLPRLYGRAGEV